MYLTSRKNFKSDKIVLQQKDKCNSHALSKSKLATITETKWASCRDSDIPIYSKTQQPHLWSCTSNKLSKCASANVTDVTAVFSHSLIHFINIHWVHSSICLRWSLRLQQMTLPAFIGMFQGTVFDTKTFK